MGKCIPSSLPEIQRSSHGSNAERRAEEERIQLQVPSELIRTQEMSRKLGNLYRAWVDAGRPMRDVGERS